MPAANDITLLGQRVAATHGWAAAKAFKAYVWTEEDQAGIAACAADILQMFPKADGADDLLTATLAFQLQRRLQAPVHLVAGTLRVEGHAVREGRLPDNRVSPFADGEPAWHGHLWVMAGAYVVDAAIFRLANRADCPPPLARHVHMLFGPDKGLYADHWRRSKRVGLDYEPLHVLSDEDMTRLLASAYHLIAESKA